MSNSIDPKQERTRSADGGKLVASIFEWLGILNKGSSSSPATQTAEEAAKTAGVNSNSLNVTRVSGLGTLVGSLGVATLAIFSVDKEKDPAGVVMAAYISTGVIMAAALFTVGMIITADIRSRVAMSSGSAGGQAATSAPGATTTSPGSELVADWHQAVGTLGAVVARLRTSPHEMTEAWLDASASAGKVAYLKPGTDQQLLHSRLLAGHSLFVEELKKLIDERDLDTSDATVVRLRELVVSMERSLQDWS